MRLKEAYALAERGYQAFADANEEYLEEWGQCAPKAAFLARQCRVEGHEAEVCLGGVTVTYEDEVRHSGRTTALNDDGRFHCFVLLNKEYILDTGLTGRSPIAVRLSDGALRGAQSVQYGRGALHTFSADVQHTYEWIEKIASNFRA